MRKAISENVPATISKGFVRVGQDSPADSLANFLVAGIGQMLLNTIFDVQFNLYVAPAGIGSGSAATNIQEVVKMRGSLWKEDLHG
ncbi:MAG: hypothetical protein AAGG48_00800 [Planctomycetota bacterium]